MSKQTSKHPPLQWYREMLFELGTMELTANMRRRKTLASALGELHEELHCQASTKYFSGDARQVKVPRPQRQLTEHEMLEKAVAVRAELEELGAKPQVLKQARRVERAAQAWIASEQRRRQRVFNRVWGYG